MVFIKATAILSLLAAVSAAPATKAAAPDSQPLGFLALRSASPIHYGSINASGNRFWIGKQTTTYCPLTDKKTCPKGKDTTFWVNNQYGGMGMNTVVPGGQQVYVTPAGELGFTQAHSASIPAGSKTQGWSVELNKENNIFYLHNSYECKSSKTKKENGFFACPINKAAIGKGPYQVFVEVDGKLDNKNIPTKNKNDCLGFTVAGGQVGKDAAVWQYI